MKLRYVALFGVFLIGIWGGNTLIKLQFDDVSKVPDEASVTSEEIYNFSLSDIKGVTHNIDEWKGQVIVLNFWATWCPPCRKETPMFIDLQEEYGPRGLQFVGVAIDELDKVIDFTDTYGINYPTLIGAEDAIGIAKKYGNRFGSLPYTVVIDRQGYISHIQHGELKRDVAVKAITTLL